MTRQWPRSSPISSRPGTRGRTRHEPARASPRCPSHHPFHQTVGDAGHLRVVSFSQLTPLIATGHCRHIQSLWCSASSTPDSLADHCLRLAADRRCFGFSPTLCVVNTTWFAVHATNNALSSIVYAPSRPSPTPTHPPSHAFSTVAASPPFPPVDHLSPSLYSAHHGRRHDPRRRRCPG